MKRRMEPGTSQAAVSARANPGTNAIACHKQRAKVAGYIVSYTRYEWQLTYNAFDRKCAYCGEELDIRDLNMDMFIPSCMGGNLVIDNVVPACPTCNRIKGRAMPEDVMDSDDIDYVRSRMSVASAASGMLFSGRSFEAIVGAASDVVFSGSGPSLAKDGLILRRKL